MDGDNALVASLLYGGGLRLLECLRLRVKDLAPKRRQIIVREGKGDRDRATLFPRTLERSLATHLRRVRSLYSADRKRGAPGVESGSDIRTIQSLLGHKDVRTTMIYTHVLDRDPLGVQSPFDRL